MGLQSCERCKSDENRDGLVFINGRVYCNYHADREFNATASPPEPPPEIQDEEAKERSLAFKYGGAEGYQRYLDKQARRG